MMLNRVKPVLIGGLVLLLLISTSSLIAQDVPENGWKIFEKTTFQKTFAKELGMFITWPKFNEELKSWEGKEIMLSGYIIPTTDAGGYTGTILSKFPYSMCFFCGEAGIESVAELRFRKLPPDFSIDRPYVFKGKLKLNDTDFNSLNFILEDTILMDL